MVKKLGDALGKVMNEVKAMAQRQQEMMKKAAEQQQQGNGHDPKDAAKVQAMMIAAKVKADNAKASHALKTAQRQIQFEQQTRQDQEKHSVDLQQRRSEAELQMATDAAKAAQEIQHNRLKSTEE